MERGEVRWYTFKPPDKQRPVLLLTRTASIQFLNTVTVAPITTTIRDVPSELFLSAEDGLMRDCVANFYNLQTVPQSKIGGYIATLSPQLMEEAE